MIRQIQNSFVGGELSPEIWGRQDVKRYYECAAIIKNFTVQRSGGVTKRSGTDLVDDITGITNWDAQTPNIPGVKCAKFRQDRSNGYLLVFVDSKVYFYKDGQAVTKDGQPYWVATPYTAPDLSGINTSQCGDTLFITHESYPPASLFNNDDTGTYWTYSVINFNLTTPSPSWTGGGMINTTPTVGIPVGMTCIGNSGDFFNTKPAVSTPTNVYKYCVSAVVNGEEGPTNSPIQIFIESPWPNGDYIVLSWSNVEGAEYYKVYKYTYGVFGLVASISTTQFADTAAVGTWSIPEWAYSYLSLKSTYNTSYYPGFQYNSSINISGMSYESLDETLGYNEQYNVFTAAVDSDYTSYNPSVILKVVVDDSSTYVGQIALALGAKVLKDDNTVETLGFGATGVTVWGTNTTSSSPKFVKLFTSGQIDIDTYNSGLLKFSWSPVPYKIYLIQFTGVNVSDTKVCARAIYLLPGSTSTSFTDVNVSQDTNVTPTESVSPWNDDTGYPTKLTMFQQRSVWSGIPTNVAQIIFSSLGNIYSFNKSVPTKATDQIDARMSITEPGAIRHLVPIRNTLIVLTESGEWVTTYDSTTGLSLASIRIDQHTYYGCNNVIPLKISNGFLFCQRDGRSVLEYQIQSYTIDNFMANDRTILARHLTENKTITSMAYQLGPDSLVWCSLSDGTFLTMTYVPSENVFAWSRHSTGPSNSPDKVIEIINTGALVQKQVDGVNTDTISDELYLLVERSGRLYIERMRVASLSDTPIVGEAVCMDSCQRIDLHQPVTTITPDMSMPDGYPCTVVNLEDGSSQTGTWSSGSVTVGTPVQYMMVGMPIVSNLTTLYPDSPQSPIQGTLKNVKTVTIRQRRSAGGVIGPLSTGVVKTVTDDLPLIGINSNGSPNVGNHPTIVQAPIGGQPDGIVTLNTNDSRVPLRGAWNREGQLSITHDSYWPMNILSLIYNIDIGEAD